MKNKIIFVTVIGLLLIVAFLFITRQKGSIKQELKSFAVTDTGGIDKIFLADMAGHQVLIERQSPSRWIVNKKYIAREDVIKTLLYTIAKVEVKSPIAKAAHNNVVSQLATSSVKTELYKNGALYKTYYVGGPTQNQLGTFMLLEGSSVPFIMHIPGFDGYLTTRFSPMEDDWRQRIVFDFPENTIRELEITYPYHPEFSFRMDVENRVIHSKETTSAIAINKLKLDNYLSLFKKVPFENWERKIELHQKDSILSATPVAVVIVKDKKGKISSLKVLMKSRKNTESGVYENDPDRMYAQLNDEKELLIIQHYTFDKLLATFKDFSGKNPLH